MSRRLAKARAEMELRRGGPPRRSRMVLWFFVGLVAAIPAVWLRGALLSTGAPDGPGGRAAGPPSPAVLVAVDAHVQRAYELVVAERHAEAYDELMAASRLDPTDPRPHLGLGDVCKKLNYDELAEQSYRKAVELVPGDIPARKKLIEQLYDLGKSEEAMRLLREMEKERPDDSFVWAELALNHLQLGQPREAVPLLERYNAREGRQAWGFENLGRAYASSGELEKAERSYREAIAMDPNTALSNLWLGQLLITQGKRAEAEGFLAKFHRIRELQTQVHFAEQAINRKPNDINALVRLAHLRTLLGKNRQALVPLRRALVLAPSDERLKRLHDSVSRAAQEEEARSQEAGPAVPPSGAVPEEAR